MSNNLSEIELNIEKFDSFESLNNLIQKYHWPSDLTAGIETPEVFPRIFTFQNQAGKDSYVIAICNIDSKNDHSPNVTLDPLLIVAEPKKVNFLIQQKSHTEKEVHYLFDNLKFNTNDALIASFLSKVYSNYRLKLTYIKSELEDLEQQSHESTKNKNLVRIKNIRQAAVTLEHTLETQHQALEKLFELDDFTKDVSNQSIIYNIKTAERQVTKLIEVYRDLIDAISGLFSDIMSNNLNHLMKYLDSAALIISVPSLVAGWWGMNTGGLPGKESSLGFWTMILVSGILAFIMWIILKLKKYND